MKSTAEIDRGTRCRGVGAAALAAGGLDLLFWILYSTSPVPLDPMTRAYEGAFPIADAILGLALVAAGIGLLRGSVFGFFFLIAAAGASIHLGIVDVTFYAKGTAYAHPSAGVAIEILVNAASIGGGLFGLLFCWRRWRRVR
jgi:hypothetical protein